MPEGNRVAPPEKLPPPSNELTCLQSKDKTEMSNDLIKRPKMSRRRFLRAAALLSCCAAGFYTWRLEPHWLEIIHRQLPIAHLPENLRGARLVQLSDLHIGPRVDDSWLLKTFDIASQIAPDILVYTGDFISMEPDILTHARRIMAHLPKGKLGTVGILGNHDHGLGWDRPEVPEKIAEIARSAGIQVLQNEITQVNGLQIAGMDDLWAGCFDPVKTLNKLDSQAPAIVLSHNPDTVDRPGWGQYAGWILAGHTHGGQCKPPLLPPPINSVHNRAYVAGEYALADGRRLYINRGLGHLLQVRFNARPEITVFQLERA
jgi:uncharacterized protein